MFASFAGEFVDLRAHPTHQSLHPEKTIGYPVGNALAEAARVRGLNGIIYPSVRDPGGTCLVALFPHAVQSVAQGNVYRMISCGKPKPTVEMVKGEASRDAIHECEKTAANGGLLTFSRSNTPVCVGKRDCLMGCARVSQAPGRRRRATHVPQSLQTRDLCGVRQLLFAMKCSLMRDPQWH